MYEIKFNNQHPPALVEGSVQLEEEIDTCGSVGISTNPVTVSCHVPGSVTLHEFLSTAAFTVVKLDTPPDPYPVASDMETKNF